MRKRTGLYNDYRGAILLLSLGLGLGLQAPAYAAQDQEEQPAAIEAEPGQEPSGPEHGGPEHGGPEHGGPEHGGPEHGGPEHGGPEHGGPEHGGPEHGHGVHHRLHVGFTAAAIAAFNNPIEGLYGGGAFLTVIAVPSWLEIELVVRAFKAPEATELPIDLLFKIPFHANHWLHPFIGLGPTVVPVFTPDGVQVHYGAASVFGADLWLSPHVGLVIEIIDNLVYHPAVGETRSGMVTEIGGGGGLLIGF